MKLNGLTNIEKQIIENKGTEAPFTGEYDDYFVDGVYLCRRCNALLYDSKDKFDSHCGWPSFDDEIPGSIKRMMDEDGRRTEILCANCEAHLGHVFNGERLTEKDTRHCVNSLSLRFIPRKSEGLTQTATLAGGCFWCLEASFRNFKGIKEAVSGYAGGTKDQPSYAEVSSGQTGHAEAVRITFDPTVISYGQILEIFFTIHNPTTLNRQGNDVGPQYRSMVLYETWEQKLAADKAIKKLTLERAYENEIVTEVVPLARFYQAEEYHQRYYEKNPGAAYCQAVISPKLSKIREQHKDLLR